MDTGFLHKAAEQLQQRQAGLTDDGVEIPVRTLPLHEDEDPGGAPVEPLYPDQVSQLAELLNRRLDDMASGAVYARAGEPPEEIGHALNLDAGLMLIALDEVLRTDEAGVEQLQDIVNEWGQMQGEPLPEDELHEFLRMADEYRRAWRDLPQAEPFPFIVAIGATDTFMLAEDENQDPDPDEVTAAAAAMLEDAVRLYRETVAILGSY